MAAPDYFVRKPTFNRSRSGLGVPGASSPASPHTPLLTRSLSSQLGSPAAPYRVEEDSLVFEIGSRSFRAGFVGDSAPRCIIPFGPDQNKRLNDFTPSASSSLAGDNWAKDWELWDLDVRNVNLGLTEDKIERAIREAYTRHLMQDQRPRKLVLALPSTLPYPLISATLSIIFNSFQASSVQLWPTPVLCAVSAGLRSALVIDIGWHETTVTALYEYREVLHNSSTRAAKMLTHKMADALRQHASTLDHVSFATAEDIVTRMAWCRVMDHQRFDDSVSLPLGANSSRIPFEALAEPAEHTFFTATVPAEHIDDHDLPIHLLAYRCLLSLPLDVRAICISRITVTGGASDIPGLKPRLLREIETLVNAKGWDPVMNYGSAKEKKQQAAHQRSMSLPTRGKPPDTDGQQGTADLEPSSQDEQSLARNAPQERDEVNEKLQREALRRGPTVRGTVRGVDTLGAWAGASLVASLKVDAAFEIKRDDFLKHGLSSLGHAF